MVTYSPISHIFGTNSTSGGSGRTIHDLTPVSNEFAAVLERAMRSTDVPHLDPIDDGYRDMLEEIEERARENREAHARRREADRNRDKRMHDLRLGEIEESIRSSEEVTSALSDRAGGESSSSIERLEEHARELMESLRDALRREDGETDVGLIQRALDRAEELISKIEDLLDAGERFDKLVEILNDVFERMRSGRERSEGQLDETLESIERKLTDELRSIASELRSSSAGSGDGTKLRSGGGSEGAETAPELRRFDAAGIRRFLSGGEEGNAVSSRERTAVGEMVRRLDSDRRAHRSAEAGSSAQLRSTNSGSEGGSAAEAVRASERLAERLKELADLLEEDGETGRSGTSARESNRRSGLAERELIFDVRDRRSDRNDSPRHHRRSERTSGESRGSEARENVEKGDGRSRPVHRSARSDGEASDNRSGSERSEAAERSGARGRTEGGTTQRAQSDFEAIFDRSADRPTPADRGNPATPASGGRTLRSDVASELARHLRESGNGEIVRQARVILRDNNLGELRLVLKPDGLGTVRMRMELEDKRIEMRIFVENSGVREVIRENLANLQRAFEAEGFTTGEFHVDVEGDGSDGASGQERATAESGAADSSSSSGRGAQELDDAVPMLDGYDDGERHINLVV